MSGYLWEVTSLVLCLALIVSLSQPMMSALLHDLSDYLGLQILAPGWDPFGNANGPRGYADRLVLSHSVVMSSLEPSHITN